MASKILFDNCSFEHVKTFLKGPENLNVEIVSRESTFSDIGTMFDFLPTQIYDLKRLPEEMLAELKTLVESNSNSVEDREKSLKASGLVERMKAFGITLDIVSKLEHAISTAPYEQLWTWISNLFK